MLNFYGLVLAPKAEKRISSNLKKIIIQFEEDYHPICKDYHPIWQPLGPNNRPKMLKVGPKFFQP
jgi:hypothetical protein